MGFFSWKTSDTDKSVSNIYSNRGALPCKMLAPDGRIWEELNYEGYGEFGDKDFYELLAELNGLDSDRDKGINLVYKDNPTGDNTQGVVYPRIVSINFIGEYRDVPNSETCPDQGFFYGREINNEKFYER